jgi:hypothetical protein
MGVYGTAPDKPDPIPVEPGKPAKATLTFDDSRTKP